MRTSFVIAALVTTLSVQSHATASTPVVEKPAAIIADGAPAIPLALADSTRPYMEYRTALFQDWNPIDRSMLITTRFANTAQVHQVKAPGAARTQLSFEVDRIIFASWAPAKGDVMVVGKDVGGNEFYQLYTLKEGRLTLLTDGKSRNIFNAWSDDGSLIAYSSTRRNGTDSDLYIMDPRDPKTDRRVAEVKGGGWSINAFTPDRSKAVVMEYVSITKSNLHLLNIASGALTPIGDHRKEVAYGGAEFAPDGTLWVTSDEGSEFQRLGTVDVTKGKFTPIAPDAKWDVEGFEIAKDGSFVAYVVNEAGIARVKVLDPKSRAVRTVSALPAGSIGGVLDRTLGRPRLFSDLREERDGCLLRESADARRDALDDQRNGRPRRHEERRAGIDRSEELRRQGRLGFSVSSRCREVSRKAPADLQYPRRT